MKRYRLSFLLAILPFIHPSILPSGFSETETIDLKALAKKARPAVMLLVISDATGKEIATGTGFLVSSDGKLITNHHVIGNAASAVAKAENGGLFPVEGVLADDPKNDLVLLKIKGKDLPFLTLGNSDKIEVGTRIAVIGSPLGLEGTLTEGIVSAVQELMGDQRLLQVTAAISPGSSGSPVLNTKGEVVGVASSLFREGQALNFAIPASTAKCLLVGSQKLTDLKSLIGQKDQKDAALSDDPDWYGCMDALVAGENVKLLKRARSLVAHHPDSPEAYRLLGIAYKALRFTDDAIAAFQHAVKLEPEDAMGWEVLGVVYSRFGRNADAVTAFEQAVKLDPNSG